MAKETWRPVVGYEGLYEVSSMGRIRTLNYLGSGFPKVLRLSRRNGYLYKSFSKENHKKTLAIHRVVAESFLGSPPENCEPNHLDGNKENNFADNLKWVTRSENISHSWGLGSSRGKLRDQARKVLKYLSEGKSPKWISSYLGISRSTVSRIKLGRRWSYLTDNWSNS